MNLTSEQESSLQDYLIGEIEPICTADPKVLSMYILALLKRDDMSTDQIREFCTTELQDFLKDETKPFIERLFGVLQDMTSGSGVGHERDQLQPPAPQYNRQHDDQRREDQRDGEESGRDAHRDDARKRGRERSRSPSSSRQWNDDEEGGYDDHNRGHRGDREDRDRDRKRRRGADSSDDERESTRNRDRDRHRDGRDYRTSSSRRHDHREGRTDIDRPLASSRGRDELPPARSGWVDERSDQQLASVAVVGGRYGEGSRDGWGGRNRGARDGRDSRLTGRKRGICYDFEERGVCVKGENCEYEHLGRPLVVDEAGLSTLQSIVREDNNDEAGAYNPEDPFLNRTGPIPVWQGSSTSQRAAPVPRGSRGGTGFPPSTTPLHSMPPMAHMPSRMGGQGVLPLPTLPTQSEPFGDGLIPTPGAVPHTYVGGRGRGMRGGWGGGRGDYHQRRGFGEDSGFGHDAHASDAVTLGPGHRHHDNQGGGRGFSRHKRGRFEGGDYRGGRPPRPQTDSICVGRIPAELNTIDKLNEHFKKFGTIVNIQLDPANKQAFVQFTSHSEALLALRSPEAVMGNRFIQVYLKTEQQPQQHESAQPVSTPQPRFPQVPPKPFVPAAPLSATVPHRPPVAAPVTTPPASVQAKNIDLLKKKQQELLSKQLEQQKKLLALLEKMQGTNSKEKDEIKAQLTALTAKIAESMKKAREGVIKPKTSVPPVAATPAPVVVKPSAEPETKVAVSAEESKTETEKTATGGAVDSNGSDEASNTAAATATTTSTDDVSQEAKVEALQKTLASLQEEAKKLGVPASQIAAQVAGLPALEGVPMRGRGRGIRARAAPWWARGRGSRGRGRGRGFAVAASRSFKLDNRTTVICVHDVPEELRDEAALRAHFQAFGSVISLVRQADTNNFLVQFSDRYMAEMAINKGTTLQGHTLNITWHDTTPASGTHEASETAEGNQVEEEVEEYQGGDSFSEADFDLGEEGDEEDKDDERSWKRE